MRPLVATAIGDPAGVGPEVCVKALADGGLRDRADYVLVGSLDVLQRAVERSHLDVKLRPVATVDAARHTGAGDIAVLDDAAVELFPLGEPTANSGRAAYRWLRRTIDLAERSHIDAMLVAPVDTTAFELAGIDWVADFEPENCYLLRTTGKLRTVPIAEHVPICDVPATVTRDRVLEVILLIGKQFQTWGVPAPRIAVAGLNPHCAGKEEGREIAPAIAAARAAGFDVTGPVSPDAVFRLGVLGRFDVIVTMYHDQGQIAVKTVGLEDACTIFVGMPYVRIGIPHGSAMDIAASGTAQYETTLRAMSTAATLAGGHGL